MKKSRKNREMLEVFSLKVSRYSLICLLSVVFLPDTVGARNSFNKSQIAQAPTTKPIQSEVDSKLTAFFAKMNQMMEEARELALQTSPQAKRQAIAKYEEILKNLRLPEVRDLFSKKGLSREYEGDALFGIGSTYTRLSENKKAAEYLEQALVIYRVTKITSGVNGTLYLLGHVYTNLGEKQKALDAFNQAKLLFRSDNKPKEEAQVLSAIASVYFLFGESKKMIEVENQILAIQDANRDISGKADTLADIGLAYQTLGDTDKALKNFNEALEIYRQTKDLLGQARIFSFIGSTYTIRNKHQQSKQSFQQALELQKTFQAQLQQTQPKQDNNSTKSPDKVSQAARTRYKYLSVKMQILHANAANYHLMGELLAEIDYLNQALSVAREAGIIDSQANYVAEIGQAYLDLGETQKALDNLNQALKIQRTINSSSGEAGILKRIAFTHKQSSEFQLALDKLNQALEVYRRQQNPLDEGETLADIANVYKDLGAYDLSIEKYKEAITTQREYPLTTARNLDSIATAYWERAKSQKSPEDYQKALDYFNEALKIARQQGSILRESSILSGIARTYESLNNYPQAILNAKLGLELSRKHNIKSIKALNSLTTAYIGAGDYQNALETSKQGLLLSQQLGSLSSQASIYQNQGKIYTAMKQPQQAIEAYDRELKLGQQIGDTSYQIYPLYQIAVIERDRGNLDKAKIQIETAIEIIEKTRGNVRDSDLRTSYFATQQDAYKFYIDLLMQLHKKNPKVGYDAEALHASERSRARSLIELLTQARADIRKGVDLKLLAAESSLLLKRAAKEKLLSQYLNQQESSQRIAATQKEIADIINQLKQVEAKIRVQSPERAELTNPQNLLKLPQIQQQLDKDTLLLEYSLGEERSYLWAVTPTSLFTYELPGRKEIEIAAEKFRSGLQQASADDLAIKSAQELGQIILAPIADKLPGKRLVIVGSGALQTIPFAALQTPPLTPPLLMGGGKEGGRGGYQPLMLNHEIVNLPSASTIATHRQKLAGRKVAPNALAILADPVYEATDERVTGKGANTQLAPELKLQNSSLARSAQNLKRDSWARLPNTQVEANTILNLIKPSTSLKALSFDANYKWATNPALNQYRILHFATHGFVDEENPESSGIVLSLIDKKGNPIRGYLRLADLFNLDYPAELIVLSACQTGLGKEVSGEGLVGLTRGLMYAGAARVVVSLWSVNDEGTSVLMQEFYEQMLQQNKTPVAALGAAQKKLWSNPEWRSPYYWAGFTVQGEWQ